MSKANPITLYPRDVTQKHMASLRRFLPLTRTSLLIIPIFVCSFVMLAVLIGVANTHPADKVASQIAETEFKPGPTANATPTTSTDKYAETNRSTKTLAKRAQAAAVIVEGQLLFAALLFPTAVALCWIIYKRGGIIIFSICLLLGVGRGCLNAIKLDEGLHSDELGATFLSPHAILEKKIPEVSPEGLGEMTDLAYPFWITAGIMVLSLCFVCLGIKGKDEIRDLQDRRFGLLLTAVAAAIIFSIGMFRLRGLMLWPVYLYPIEMIDSLEALVIPAVNLWAFWFSVNLLIMISLAMLALRTDTMRAAYQAVPSRDLKEVETWIEQKKLSFPVKDVMTCFIAAGSPLATSGILGLISGL